MSGKATIKWNESWPDVANQDSKLIFPHDLSEGYNYDTTP